MLPIIRIIFFNRQLSLISKSMLTRFMAFLRTNSLLSFFCSFPIYRFVILFCLILLQCWKVRIFMLLSPLLAKLNLVTSMDIGLLLISLCTKVIFLDLRRLASPWGHSGEALQPRIFYWILWSLVIILQPKWMLLWKLSLAYLFFFLPFDNSGLSELLELISHLLQRCWIFYTALSWVWKVHFWFRLVLYQVFLNYAWRLDLDILWFAL